MATTKKTKQQSLAALPFWRRAAKFVSRGLRWMFRTFATVLTVLLALLLLVSTFSDQINPNTWILMPFFGLVYPILLLGSFLWTVFVAIARRWGLVCLMLTVLLLSGGRIYRYCPVTFFAPIPEDQICAPGVKPAAIDSLTIITFNTHSMGKVNLSKDNQGLEVLEVIRESNADIVCLQEYTFSASSGFTEEKILSSLRKKYPYYDFLPAYNSKNFGIALFSRYPIKHKETVDKDSKEYFSARYYELNVHGTKLALLNCHLKSNSIPPKDRKGILETIEHIGVENRDEWKSGLHHLVPAWRKRAQEVLKVREFLDEVFHYDKDLPCIVCGDFNDAPISFTYNLMRGDMEDAWVDTGNGMGITYHEMPFLFRIDYILHTQRLHTLRTEVLKDVELSDHYPLKAVFQLLPAPENNHK